jgi:hypothetical protein
MQIDREATGYGGSSVGQYGDTIMSGKCIPHEKVSRKTFGLAILCYADILELRGTREDSRARHSRTATVGSKS